MTWVSEIANLVGREANVAPVNWDEVEVGLGSSLPRDYKDLFEIFGYGEFSGYLTVLSPFRSDSLSVPRRLESMRRSVDSVPYAQEFYAPYGVYREGGEGLISWGVSELGDEFCWLAKGNNPDGWPIVARERSEDWIEFEMVASEFVYRVISDASFRPFSVADVVDPPYFEVG